MKKKGKSKVKNKELETSITAKFTEALHGLGHNVESLKKEIAKAGKTVSEKITKAFTDAQKATTKEADKAKKLTKKADKKKPEVKTVANKAEAKVDKLVSAVAKAASGKSSTASGRSVAKPAAPTLDPQHQEPTQKEAVKEAPAPVKRTRAPRRKKEEIEAAASAEKAPVKEASAPAKRKRGPNKPKPVATSEEKPATETTGSAVL